MTHSPLTDAIRLSPQNGPRDGVKIKGVQLHHQASTNNEATIAMMVNRTRQVSANYVVSNEGVATLVVDEDRRAWTSGSPIDDKAAVTFEIENETGAPTWSISSAAFHKVARLIADLSNRYGFPINRTTVYGHRELWTRYRRSYSTACPGGLDLDGIVRQAQEYQRGTGGVVKPQPAPASQVAVPAFPLPAGSYFGPKSGPAASVSGYFSHRSDLARWQGRMAERGWDLSTDGLYGPQTAAVARAFQQEKGLGVDGLIGPQTWASAWSLPVT
jgi:N-acetyl-anhydromuramyl-L-alanine amidase AmpD